MTWEAKNQKGTKCFSSAPGESDFGILERLPLRLGEEGMYLIVRKWVLGTLSQQRKEERNNETKF